MADDMRFCEACGAPAPVAAPQQPVYQQAPQQPVYQQAAPQQPVYPQPQQPVYQSAQPAYRPAPAAAPAKTNSFDINKILDQVKTFANGFVNRCKADKKFLLICCGIAAAVLLVIILAICLLAKPGYTAPIDTYISVMTKGKAKKIESLAPKAYWEWYEEENDEDVKDVIEDFEDEWEDYIEEMEDEYGDRIRITYEIDRVKDLSDKKLEKIAEALDDKYDIPEKSVKAGKVLKGEMTIEGSDDDDDEDMEVTVIKIGSKWYWVNYYEYGDEYYVSFNIPG